MKKADIILGVSMALLGLPGAALAQARPVPPRPELVSLGQGVIGALYRPASDGPKAQISMYVMHAEQDYLNFSACTELAARGYTVLCANNSASKTGLANDLDFERMMLDVARGMTYLRQRPGTNTIVLFGHSGGGALMAAYQNVAENGLKACQGSEKIAPCSDALKSLPPADGVILADANYGLSGMVLLSLDPAITDEQSGSKRDAALDLFAPANGSSLGGAAYSSTFRKRFQTAVASRMNRLIDTALRRKSAIASGAGRFADDEPIVVPGANYVGFNNKLFAQDPSLLSRTSKAWPLLHPDGTTTTEIVRTVRPASNLKSKPGTLAADALKTTVNRFLTTFAVRVGPDFAYGPDGFEGVDWSSSHTTPIAAARGITVPLLTMGMTGHWEFLAAEKIYLAAGSRDKSVAFVEGASHVLTTCRECETTPGQFGDTQKVAYDYVANWLDGLGRFPKTARTE